MPSTAKHPLLGSVFIIAVVLAVPAASAVECPAAAKSCKVLTLTPEEENALIAPNGLLVTAAQARKLDLGDVAAFFIQRIKDAPAGEVKAEPTPTPSPTPDKKK